MKRIIFGILTLLLCAQNAQAMSVDAWADKYIAPVSDAAAKVIFYPVTIFGSEVPVVILWILFAGLFFTIYLKGIAFTGFKHAIDVLIKPADTSGEGGEVSPLGSLMTALSGTIGLGSIAGVAISISIGGPGAAFWILVGSILGMSLKFVEAALAVKYRKFNADGSISGGPMHYMAHGLTRKKLRWLGQPLSVIFAVLCIGGGIAGGCMVQINQAAAQMVNSTGGVAGALGGLKWLIGLIMAIVVGMIIIGGIKSIAKAAEMLTPLKMGVYLISALIVIVLNFKLIPHAGAIIVKQAFRPDAIYGGMFGAMIMGLRRSVQCNEAGTGSAPIAYASAKTNEPISQGFVALLEPFLTGIMCMLTAFAIVITGAYKLNAGATSGIEMTSAALSTSMSFFPKVLAIIVLLYALSTMISWAYYGQKSWNFLFGEGRKRTLTFQFIYCASIVLGAIMNITSIINLTDAMMIAMSIPNIITMYILAPEIKRDLEVYCQRFKLGVCRAK